jgi:multicomponent Na+:H+ antiporter subunit A
MVGLGPLLGFVAKEAALEATLHEATIWVVAGVVAGSILTFAYTARFLWGGFAGKPQPDAAEVESERTVQALLRPAVLLTVPTVILGLVPGAATWLVSAAGTALDASASGTLYLWHGLTVPLLLSALVAAAGTILFLLRAQVERIQRRIRWELSTRHIYEGAITGLNRVADRVTGVVQSGSLPVYVGVILLTAVVLPATALVGAWSMPSTVMAESPLQVVVAAGVLGAALAVTAARRRMVAVLLLGAVGFGVAVLFVIQGAPDLALTQLLIETLTLVIFALVLRHLPSRFTPSRWRIGNGLRLGVALSVGVFVACFALVAVASPAERSTVAAEHIGRALPEAEGRNVVNVILTDFRALDTLGEISVLSIAALGITSLVLTARREEADDDAG